ncbi:NAD(P)-dependent oxidoreductase [Sphingobium sp. Sx8-8]|uniref:NAD-dependent epimerase/dehydratase family protein n=1 Tax=Sphingobium sp. Sx8-8 TaxID=2933617 RepID=UPI001F569B1D|nr:NAD(P)-dependent oxidoreductase [Sphingobium sp. Sx8-8]
MANILVTGGTGLIGWCTAELLVEQGHRVVLYDLKPILENIAHLGDRVTVVAGDVTDLPKLLHVMRNHDVDHILHLAAFITDQAKLDPAGAFKVNAVGSANIFDAALATKIRRVVWTSSVIALGIGPGYDGTPVDESYNVVSRSPYGASKWGCEVIADGYRALGLDVVGIRPALTYGLGRLTGGTGIFNAAIRSAALGEAAGMMASPSGLHQPMYNRDMAGLLVEAMLGPTPPHGIYNAPAERSYSDTEIVDIVSRVFPSVQVHTDPLPDFIPQVPLVDGSRARREIAYTPRYTLEDGIREMGETFRFEASAR